MLHAPQPGHLRQIQHLPRLRLHDRRPRQIRATTIALRQRVHLLLVGKLAALKMMALMPRLTARLAARTPPQAPLLLALLRLRRLLCQPIRGGRPRRIPRGLRQTRAQLRDQRIPLSDRRLKLSDPSNPLRQQPVPLQHPLLKLRIARPRPPCISDCNHHAPKVRCAPPQPAQPTPPPDRQHEDG